jgi:hypothetical protein
MQLKANRRLYIKEQLKIKNQAAKTVPFELNVIQEKVDEVVKKLEDAGKPVRIKILKARREGMTTYVAGKIFHNTVTNVNIDSLIISHEPESTQAIFEIYKLFYEELEDIFRPMCRYDNKNELVFDNPNDKERLINRGFKSKIKVATANKLQLGRASLNRNLHGSEVGFWKNARVLMTAVLQTVPDLHGTSVFLESTANGVGNWWQISFMRSWRGEDDYVALFFSWFDFPDYSRKVTELQAKVIMANLDDEEKVLVKKHKCSVEQLAWRRWMIPNKCQNDIDIFHQEYPSTVEEAFISSGRPVFNRNKLQLQKLRRGMRGYLEQMGGDIEDCEFMSDTKGELVIYTKPNPNRSYVIGGDVAEGELIESETEDIVEAFEQKKGDYSVLVVIDSKTRNVVAVWRGHIDPDLLGDKAVELAYYYNGALVAIEANKDGRVTNKRILKLEYPRRQVYFCEIVDTARNKKTKKMGWITSPKTRPFIISAVRQYIRECEGKMNNKDIHSECMTFIVTESGKEEAEAGCYDDCVIALGIALNVLNKYASKLVVIGRHPERKLKNPKLENVWEDTLMPDFDEFKNNN